MCSLWLTADGREIETVEALIAELGADVVITRTAEAVGADCLCWVDLRATQRRCARDTVQDVWGNVIERPEAGGGSEEGDPPAASL